MNHHTHTPRSHTALWLLIVLALVAAACSNDTDTTLEFIAADDIGNDPFTTDIAQPAPTDYTDIADELNETANNIATPQDILTADDPAQTAQDRTQAVITTAQQNGLAVIAPASPIGVGLYGGTGINACDTTGLIGFLEQNPQQAQAFANVHNITTNDIEDFINNLTAGFLLADTPLINHTFTNGTAKPIDAILEAGTAVLVDNQGIPRIRCKCGNPLKPLTPVTSEPYVESTFSDGDEQWQVTGDAQGSATAVEYIADAGQPAGSIAADDNVTGGTWYWSAPPKFLTPAFNASEGAQLRFDLGTDGGGPAYSDPYDIVLVGADRAIGLRFAQEDFPATAPRTYTVALSLAEGWDRLGVDYAGDYIDGTPAAAEDITSVLSNLTALRIRGEYTIGSDRGSLDNVRFGEW